MTRPLRLFPPAVLLAFPAALAVVLPGPGSLAGQGSRQTPNPGEISKQIEQGCATLPPGGEACSYDFRFEGRHVEAISFRPAGPGPFPGVLMIPGYERTARDLIPLAERFVREGFAAVAVSQPGFGKSDGPPDFVGPKTLAVLTAAYRKLGKESYVDPGRLGLYGYSRGGMAASLLAIQLDGVKAAVLGAGVYDFQRLYDESRLPGVRKNMREETGMTRAAVLERSSIFRMDQVRCPLLILHGENDENVPVSQAIELRDRLTELHKEFEIRLFPGKPHSIGPEAGELAVDFLKRKLMPRD